MAAYEKTALMKQHYKIAKTLNECLAKLSEADGKPEDMPSEAKFVREKKQRRATLKGTLGLKDKRATSSFVFATIEENGEMAVGDEEEDDAVAYKGVHAHGKTPTLSSRENSRDNLRDAVGEK